MAKNYYSLKEVRDVVFNNCISQSLILKMVNNNQIPCLRCGGRILVPTAWVNEMIKTANGVQYE